jgi:hypothetical protein
MKEVNLGRVFARTTLNKVNQRLTLSHALRISQRRSGIPVEDTRRFMNHFRLSLLPLLLDIPALFNSLIVNSLIVNHNYHRCLATHHKDIVIFHDIAQFTHNLQVTKIIVAERINVISS